MHTMTFKAAAVLFTFGALQPLGLFGQDATIPAPSTATPSYVEVHTYDHARNAATDIDRAVAEARKTGKRILVEIGGDWCPWCHSLDNFFQQHPDLLQLRDRQFITVDVYYGKDQKNEQVLSRYSKVLGIPHFFVLDDNGTLLHSQHVVELEAGGSYSTDKMKEFLIKWSAPNRNTASN